MASPAKESPITYSQLADLEKEFDDVDREIIRYQAELTRPLYEKRQKFVDQIPNFWALVLEQAPPEIDGHIHPSDSQVLLTSLTSLWVSRFEIENGGTGNPRSVAIRFEFAPNAYFEDTVLEKKFWYRRSKGGWGGLVSEPVDIKWKPGKDLTGGLLSMVKAVWDEEQAAAEGSNGAAKKGSGELTPKQKVLKNKIENTGVGGQSFFAWFGYRGRAVSAEESRITVEEEKQQRQLRATSSSSADQQMKETAEDEDDDDEDDLEIFPDGEMLALAISDDLWPGALWFFKEEGDGQSEDDFESEEEGDDEGDDDAPQDGSPGARPAKKRKA
ncbi:hypothetical protein B0T26DRAFT_129319 [Lasiosphaeria miniovina]|uniref:Nap family protein n=1 Tax=Lasiosphaeria miniovina TaxID=1954250 RepID=A0AA40B429_9PEZI|nr:uncharacterized protein B0T26DRAFT_129319 [Lasiosphaeria miniovina]KAK0727319.1 hypothetical protein B0T26DRAFT_129319 [Lasiosphaeria miniovina]